MTAMCIDLSSTMQNKGTYTFKNYFVNSFSLSCSCTVCLTGCEVQVNVYPEICSQISEIFPRIFHFYSVQNFALNETGFSNIFSMNT